MTGHLVVVAGHAVLKRFGDPGDEANWYLLDFQRGETGCYVEHVRRGVELAAADPDALLMLSGGQSRAEAGPHSEALSYHFVAESFEWFGAPRVGLRTHLEEFARDSFENLLFSLCRYKELTGSYPAAVTLVSWGFKEQRFQWHRECIRWPERRFEYSAPNNPPEIEQALRAEHSAMAKYRADPYSSGAEFRRKRDERNPFRRQHGYYSSCPELAPLLRFEGPGLYGGAGLPWDI
jgi:hypothetical protein